MVHIRIHPTLIFQIPILVINFAVWPVQISHNKFPCLFQHTVCIKFIHLPLGIPLPITPDSEQASVGVKFATIVTIKLTPNKLSTLMPFPIRIKSRPVTIQGPGLWVENAF